MILIDRFSSFWEKKVLEDEEDDRSSDQNGDCGDYKLSPASMDAASSLCSAACGARSGMLLYIRNIRLIFSF